MINVLWLCNIVLPELASEFGFKSKENMGGWLVGLWELLKKSEGIELSICVPIRNVERLKDGKKDRNRYFSFVSKGMGKYSSEMTARFVEILSEVNPQAIHIWGTEYPHTKAMILAAKSLGMSDRIVINIQGLLTYCSDYICYKIPEEYLSPGSDILSLHDSFVRGAVLEREVIKEIKNVIGRTDWDRDCLQKMNPSLKYYHCGEVLKPNFYLKSGGWKYENCSRHTIFVSQAGYPLKGFHMIVSAVARLKSEFDDLKVYVAGPDMTKSSSIYADYLRRLLSQYRLCETVVFVGNLSADEMISRYLDSNVYLSPSLMENSSNSICEAMMLGVPVVASNVGGTKSIVEDNVSGCLFQVDAIEKCIQDVRRIFNDNEFAEYLSYNGVNRSLQLSNREAVVNTTIDIYQKIVGEEA